MKNNRRSFLQKAGILTGSIALPGLSKYKIVADEVLQQITSGNAPTDEAYWAMVKGQFTIPNSKIMANSANLCPSPFFINDGIAQFNRELAKDVSFQYRALFSERRSLALNKMATYLGVDTSQLGITRNTSEANNIIVNGLDLSTTDEVILWDQNHPSNLITWQHRAERYGFKVRVISMPVSPQSKDEILEVFKNSISKNTRLIGFSHISNVSGLALPVKDICQWAHSKNIMTLVDGAQSFGFLKLDLTDIGCSFYTASTHKWLMGPMENGILYVHKSHQNKLWPNIIAAGWNPDMSSVDDLYCHLGQRHTPGTALLPDILDFHEAIGFKKLEKRVIHLNSYLKNKLQQEIEDIQFVTPESEEFSGGVTIFSIPEKDNLEIFKRLYSDFHIASAPVNGIRMSPTITTTLADMDKIVSAVGSLTNN